MLDYNGGGSLQLAIPQMDISTTSRASALTAVPQQPSPVQTFASGSSTVHKEVPLELIERERTRHRKEGDVPYPFRCGSCDMNLYDRSADASAYSLTPLFAIATL